MPHPFFGAKDVRYRSTTVLIYPTVVKKRWPSNDIISSRIEGTFFLFFSFLSYTHACNRSDGVLISHQLRCCPSSLMTPSRGVLLLVNAACVASMRLAPATHNFHHTTAVGQRNAALVATVSERPVREPRHSSFLVRLSVPSRAARERARSPTPASCPHTHTHTHTPSSLDSHTHSPLPSPPPPPPRPLPSQPETPSVLPSPFT